MNLRKLTLLLATAFLFQTINAQDDSFSGQFVIGGSFNFLTQNNAYPTSALLISSGIGGIGSFYSNSTNQTKNSIFSFSPYVAKELNENWLLGVLLDYRLGNYLAEDIVFFSQPDRVDFERKSNQFGVGVFARYVLNPSSQFNFYLQPFAEFNFLNEEETVDAEKWAEEKAKYFEGGVGAGVLYNINDRWRVILGLGGISYVNGNWESDDLENVVSNDFSSFSTNFNLSNLRFGVEMKL